MNPNIMTLQERLSEHFGFCQLMLVATGYNLQTIQKGKIWEHIYPFDIKHEAIDAGYKIAIDFYREPKDVKETKKPTKKRTSQPRKRSSTKRG